MALEHQMVDAFVNCTGNTTLIYDNLKTLEKEYNFWSLYRTVPFPSSSSSSSGKQQQQQRLLSRYYSNIEAPRPEGFSDDEATHDQIVAAGPIEELKKNK